MPHGSYYHYFIFLTAFFSSYLRILECSMWSSSRFEDDYSPSETGSNFKVSFDSEESLLELEATRFNSGDHYMSTNTDNIFYNDFPNSESLIKRKRKHPNMKESFIVDSEDNKMDMCDFSPVDVAIEPESFKIKRVTGKDDDKILMLSNLSGAFKVDDMPGFQGSPSHSLKRSLPPSQCFPPKGFTTRLEPIETNFSPPQSINSSPLTSSSAGLISPTPLKNGVSNLLRRNDLKHANLVELSPDSVFFSPIIDPKNISVLGEKKDRDDENEYEDLDTELAEYFEGFGFYNVY